MTTMPRRSRPLAILLGALVLLATACGSSSGSDVTGSTTAPTGEPKLSGTLTVSAASSLTEGFDAIKAAFEAAHPGTTINVTYDSSSTLVSQIQGGADVDVFASADTKNMSALTDAGLIEGTPQVFAHNRLEIVTKPGNPVGIETLGDLAKADGVVSLCAADAPCGKFAAKVLEAAKVTIPESKVTRGSNARATLGAVAQGDAVAALVYVTDADAAKSTTDAVEIPDAVNPITTLPIGVLKASKHAELARAFVAAVLAHDGQMTLEGLGFLAP
jgi:molybdate transport system substrate-binding protein